MSEIHVFPITDNGHSIYAGITLRDYFAAQAIASAVDIGLIGCSLYEDIKALADAAYLLADVMMEARDK